MNRFCHFGAALNRRYASLRSFFRKEISIPGFVLLFSLANLVIYHQPLFAYTVSNLDPWSFNGVVSILVVFILLFSLTTAILLLFFALSRRIGLLICMIIAIGNSLALYFISTYQVILEKTMMANVLNTRYSEASEFIDTGLLAYLLVLGVIPCLLLIQVRLETKRRVWLLIQAVLALTFGIGSFALAANTWLWIDEHSKYLGGQMLPWAYVANGARHIKLFDESVENQVRLPPAVSTSDEPMLVILVIGETARAANFAFYGYQRPTNTVSESVGILPLANATSCTTYTTTSIRCILSHINDTSLFAENHEVLPTYLQRHGVEVIWRSKNWGEPPIRVASYKSSGELRKTCQTNCKYDEVLLTGLTDEIRSSESSKIFVVLHQKGSHGPKYTKRYPKEFEIYKPVCRSVELQECSLESLVNAYDNSIVYTDHFLGRVVDLLKQFDDRPTMMMYVSDHGESLGESGLYLHGAPYVLAPDVQKEIPFLVWLSERFIDDRGVSLERLKNQPRHSQVNVFHSVLNTFELQSEVYREQLDIFSPNFTDED